MANMRDSHRMFLQSFMTRGLLDAKEVRTLYKNCCERFKERYEESEEERRTKLQDFVITINGNIKPIGMEIKKGVSETDGSNYYGLVNTIEDNITLASSIYADKELDFIKILVEQIVESDTGSLGSTDALNLVENLQTKMSENDAQELLEKLERDKWVKMTDGRVTLDTRAIMELEQYVLDTYPNLAVRCNMCKKLCVQGQSCGVCNTKLHHHCARRFFHGQDNPCCPDHNCRSPWQHTLNNGVVEQEASTSAIGDRRSQRKRKSTT